MIRKLFLQNRLGAPLVIRIAIAVQKEYRDSFNVLFAQMRRQFA